MILGSDHSWSTGKVRLRVASVVEDDGRYQSFSTITAAADAEIRVRASRFLAHAFPVNTEAEARAVLREREARFFDARHHCAAWRLRGGSWRTIDAGEPAGSAGSPILAAIDGGQFLDVGVVVTRYFGGTKLGVGGLARAYGEAATAALAEAPVARAVPADRLEIRYPYPLTGVVMRALERYPVQDVEHAFANAGEEPVVRLSLPSREVGGFISFLREHSSALLTCDRIDQTILLEPVRRHG